MKPNPIQTIKNTLNQKINPSREETISSIDSGTSSINSNFSNIGSNISSINTNLAKIPNMGIRSSSDSLPISIASNQTTVNVSGQMTFQTPSNPLTTSDDQSLFFLRKIAKLLEPLNTVDSGRRKRVVVDASTDMSFSGTAAVSSYASLGTQMYQDIARAEFAQNIRSKLRFK